MKNNRHPFWHTLILSAEILLLWLLQSTPKLFPELFGVKPFLLLAAAVSYAVCAEAVPAVIAGAVCGVLADISVGGVGFFAFAVTLLCFALSRLLHTYINRNVLSCAVLAGGGIAAVLGLYFLLFRLFAGVPGSGMLFAGSYLPRMAYTFVCFIPLYFLNDLLCRRL